jgi:PAS domain S-box-containing protein
MEARQEDKTALGAEATPGDAVHGSSSPPAEATELARRWALRLAGGVGLVAVTTLVVRGLGVSLPAGWAQGPTESNALGLLVLAAVLALRARLLAGTPGSHRRWWEGEALVGLLLAVPAVLGAVVLLDRGFGVELGARLLPSEGAPTAARQLPGRPSMLAAAVLVTFSGALFLVARRRWWPPLAAAIVLLAIASWFSLLALLFAPDQLSELPWVRTTSPLSALSVLALAAGIACLQPSAAPFRVLASPGAGGVSARQLLPIALLAPVAIGWLRMLGQQAGFYDLEVGVALFALGTTVVLVAAGWRNAVLLERLDRQREAAEAASRVRLAQAAVALVRARAAEQAAERAAERLGVATAGAGIGVWDWDFASGELHWDEQMHRLYGLAPGTFGGRYEHWESMVLPEEVSHLRAAGQEAIASGQDLDVTFAVRRRDGAVRSIRERAVVRRGADGRPERMVGTNEDVTAEREAAAALRAAELRFRGIFESSSHFVGLLTPEGIVLEANPSSLELLGDQAREAIGRHFWDTPWWSGDPARQAEVREAVRRGAAGEKVRYQTRMPIPGRELHVDFSLTPIRDEQGRVRLLIPEGTDISEMVRATAALRESEEKLRHAFDHATIGMALVGLDGRFLQVNEALCRIVGYSRPELMARTFLDITHPEDQGADGETLRRVREGQHEQYQLVKRYLHRDGHVVWAQVAGSLVRDAAGRPLHLVSQVQDVTRRQEAEAGLRASLAEKEVLLKEIHHRVKNNLQVISSLLQLQAAETADAAVRAMFREAQDRIRMMAMVHERLYRSGNLATIDFAGHLRELIGLVARSAGRADCAVRVVLEAAAAELDLDSAIPLGLVASELVSNSYKHAFVGREEGLLRVELVRRDGALRLAVTDDGIGLPAGHDLLASSSLGMRLIRGLCRQLGGHLVIEPVQPPVTGVWRGPGVCFAVTMTTREPSA